MANVVIRKGERKDCASILSLVLELLHYNNIPDPMSVTLKDFEEAGFGKINFFKTFVAEVDTSEGKKIVGYILYYFIFSTFEGRSNFMEELFVTQEFRCSGIGGSLMKTMIKDALENGCKRTDFSVAKWNDLGKEFYKKHGALNLTELEGWNIFMIEEENMIKFTKTPIIRKAFSSSVDNGSINVDKIIIRKGEKKDCAAILKNIIELSHYAKTPDGVKITPEILERDGFGETPLYKSFVAEADTPLGKEIVGVAIYFLAFSSYEGRGSYMEDLYVREELRHLGLGADLWKAVIEDVLKYDCLVNKFSVLEWNTPSMKFYNKYGAFNLTERGHWHYYRFEIDVMNKLTT